MRSMRKIRVVAIAMTGVMAMSLVSITPAAVAQDEVVCRGGGPEYWLTNPWPKPNYVPRLMQNPNKKRTQIRGWTRFNDVFRWRKGKDQEGKIFSNRYRLRQALKGNGTLLKTTAKHTVAALLNASATDENEFSWNKHSVIKQFQVYWDGTQDMNRKEARRYLRKQMRQLNEGSCPVVE